MIYRLGNIDPQLGQKVWETNDGYGTNPRINNIESYNFRYTQKNEAFCNNNNNRNSSDYNSSFHFHNPTFR